MKALRELILKEGWGAIAFTVFFSLFFALADCELSAFLLLVATVLLVWTYRSPVRTVMHFESASVTAPCDGKVVAVETEADGSVAVVIETAFLDASLLTMPFDGKIRKAVVYRGARLRRNSVLFVPLNERGTLVLEDTAGRRVRITHTLLPLSAALVLDRFPTDEKLVRGERYGVMLQGITRIELPPSTRVAVNPGERLLATQSLLGYMG